MNEKSVKKKINKFDANFKEDSKITYAIISNNYKLGKLFKIWLIAFISMIIVDILIVELFNIRLGSFVIPLMGGYMGYRSVSIHQALILVPNKTSITVYKFNEFQTKIISKKEIPLENIIVSSVMKNKRSYDITLEFDNKYYNILISTVTLGFKNQKENSKLIIEKIEEEVE